MSTSAFLNSFSPSRPIFSSKLSAIYRHLLVDGMKKTPFHREVGTKPSEVFGESLPDGTKKECP